jgi:hypothetical protein
MQLLGDVQDCTLSQHSIMSCSVANAYHPIVYKGCKALIFLSHGYMPFRKINIWALAFLVDEGQ